MGGVPLVGAAVPLHTPASAVRPTGLDTKGAVAQLGERLICNQEVVGSTPISSTSFSAEPGL